MKEAVIYRPEIDGLRAIAVGSVILFHAGVSALPGGFLGVDIFFVISGYLITGILVRDMDRGNFSVLRFYERRVRRIVPALNVMMLASSATFLPLLLPDDLENFGQSLIATTAFSNNILLFLTSGYFDLASDFKPLVHTWSLGVEEHYYIFAPVILLVGVRMAGRKGALYSSVALFSASLFICVVLGREHLDANFYLATSRAWELAAGAIMATLNTAPRSHGTQRNILATLGMAMVVVPLFLLSEGNNLPSWPTLLPVAGACLLLRFGDSEIGVGKFLSARPLVWAGLLSYSAYLYHQPVFVLVRVLGLEAPSTWLLLSLTPLIFLLAYFSWRYIEQPFRSRELASTGKLLTFCGVTSGAVLIIGGVLYLTSGLYQLRPELASGDPGFGAKQNVAFSHRADSYKSRELHDVSAEPNVLVVGNSFARDFVNMGVEAAAFRQVNVSYSHLNECEKFNEAGSATARSADLIIIAMNFSAANVACVSQLKRQIDRETGRESYILGPKNFGWNNNAVMLLPRDRRYAVHVEPLPEVVRANNAGRAEFSDHYIDLLALLMDREGKVPVFTPEHRFISQDRIHLTQAGAMWVGKRLFESPQMQNLMVRAELAARLRRARSCLSACSGDGTPGK